MAKATRAEWVKRVERWRDSGLTAREYAAETGLNVNTLQHWGWKLKTEASEPSKPRRRKRPTKRRDALTFIEVAGPTMEPRASFELVVGTIVVRVPASFDARALGRLLAVIRDQA